MLGPVFPDHRTRVPTLCCRLKEPTMAKTILVGLAVLTLATSAALAETQETPKTHKTTHHQHAAKPAAATPATAAPVAAAPAAAAPASPSPVLGGFFGGSAADHEMYIKNQQDSGLASGQ